MRRNLGMLLPSLLLLLAVCFQGCQGRGCPDGFFSCSDGSACMHVSRRCDGTQDCANGKDEEDCTSAYCMEPAFFPCSNRKCISSFFRCDGENDCGDFSDEANCDHNTTVTSAPVKCTEEEWQCADEMCIPKHWACNGEQDCLDGSDELQGCSVNFPCVDGFLCTNRECIPIEWVCDNSPDCSDASDEKDCHSNTNATRSAEVATKDCTMDRGLFLCKDHLNCLQFNEVCNGVSDCLDGSDEGPSCKIDTCSTKNCSSNCLKTAQGPVCYCPSGFQLSLDGIHCNDTNECLEFGSCSQKCLNTVGSYNCLCDDGYKLEDDEHSCKALGGEAMLLYSSKKDVRGLFLTSNVKFSVAQNKLKHIVGVAYDGVHVYWTSVIEGEEAVVKSKEDGSDMEAIITAGLNLPEDLAIDWVTGNIYFSDSEEHHIAVCTNDGARCTILVHEEMENNPRAIALLVHKGLMFWSRWGKSPAILRASMDGSNAKTFISSSIVWPNGIALDYPNDRLYWVDSKLRIVESVRLDGSDRKMILKNVMKHPYSIAVFENSLYWSDFEDREVFRCDKFTGKRVESVAKERKNYIYDIHIFHSVTHSDIKNPCTSADCSDLCLLTSNGSYSCACPEGKQLLPDLHHCVALSKKEVLIVGAGRQLFEIHHQVFGRQHVFEMKPSSLGEIGAMAFDSVAGNVYISDVDKKRIYALNLESSVINTVVNTSLGYVGGMDYDYLGNNLYWCDAEKGTVEAMSLTTLERTTIIWSLGGGKILDEIPLDIAVISEEGVMFIAIQGLDRPHIDRYLMDGSGIRTHVIEDLLVGPTISLSYDSDLHRVFFADSGRSTIESTDADGMDLHSYKKTSGLPSSIVTIGHDMFWVNQYQSGTLHWSNKYTSDAKDKLITLEMDKNVEKVKLISAGQLRSTVSHICHRENGGCTHLCLLSKKSVVCGCPHGMRLEEDHKTCEVPRRCLHDEFKCKTDNKCIRLEQKCNKHDDCPSGEDERDCDYSCSAEEFHCKSGECINGTKHCDHRQNCKDGSDEHGCAAETCRDNEFHCTSGECIDGLWRCDVSIDCVDGSDEKSCEEGTCSANEFRCNSGSCVPGSSECDGKMDCYDLSDEHKGCKSRPCRAGEWTCANGQCLSEEVRCNGILQCEDKSDEENCTAVQPRYADGACQDGHFFCKSSPGLCPPDSKRCDEFADCPKGEDERNCGCTSHEFECHNGNCISNLWICDGYRDCTDGSDEELSECASGVSEVEVTTACNEFSCTSGECIRMESVCDEKENCKDGSDEGGKCGSSCSVPHTCAGKCHPTPNGPHCSCWPGTTLSGNTCVDVDECAKEICSQGCVNSYGNYSCSCSKEYRLLPDGRSCKAYGPQMQLMFSTANYEIRSISPNSPSVAQILLSKPGWVIAGIDVDTATSDIYLSNRRHGTLVRVNLVTNEEAILPNINSPGRLVLDWLTKNVYIVSETFDQTIQVCNLERKSQCTPIAFIASPMKISDLAIDPNNEYLFWASFTDVEASVYRSNLQGLRSKMIFNKRGSLVSGIALNLVKREIYFADELMSKVSVMSYSGKDRRDAMKQGIQYPNSVVMFEDLLFLLDSNLGKISRCKVLGLPPKKCDHIQINSIAQHLVIFQESKQPKGVNACLNHTCTSICVPAKSTPLCLCADGSSTPMGETCGVVMSIDKVEQSNGGMIAGVVLSIVILALVLIGAYVYYYRCNSGKHSFRFGSVKFTSSESRLEPGKHQYGNPLASILTYSKANSISTKESSSKLNGTQDSMYPGSMMQNCDDVGDVHNSDSQHLVPLDS